MDDFERRVLKKRKVTIEQHVKVDDEFLAALKRNSVLNDESIAAVVAEKTNTAKLVKIVEVMIECPNLSTFENFCTAILLTHTEVTWLAKELQAEVKADRGNLQIDEDVSREAATIVHRKFGTSKRFGESDKKEIQELLAIKIQLSKEEFRHELEQLRQDIHDREGRYQRKDEQALVIRDRLVRFIKDNESWLTSKAHGMKTTTDILRTSVADDDLLSKMEEVLRHLLLRVERVLKEHDLLLEDKQKCMELLGIEEDTAKLHSALKRKMTDLPEEVAQCKAELKDKNDTIGRLRKILSEAEKECTHNEAHIKSLEKELAVLKETLTVTKEEMRKMEDQAPPSTPESGESGEGASSRKGASSNGVNRSSKGRKSATKQRTK